MIRIYPNYDTFETIRNYNWLPFVKYEEFFRRNNLEYSMSDGAMALIICDDKFALEAAKDTVFYPLEMVTSLIDKSSLPSFMASFGFNELPTKRIFSVADIGSTTNFIIKPIVFTNGSVIANLPINNFSFRYKKFVNVETLTAVYDINLLDAALANGDYCVQQAVMDADFDQVTISGSVNGKGEVYFRRHAVWQWRNNNMVFQVRERQGYEVEKNLLSSMLSQVKNAAFGVQFISIDNKLYPIDWNFRDPPRTTMVELALCPQEFEQALAHQFDIPHEKIISNDVWETSLNVDFSKSIHTIKNV